MHLSSTLLGLGLSLLLAQAQLNKPPAWDNLDFISSRLSSLPKVNARISPWTSGNIPEACYKYATGDSLDPKTFKAFTIFMDDCDVGPFVICRQNGGPTTIEATVDALARIPVGVRQWIGTLTLYKDGGGGSAPGHDVILKGTSAGGTSVMIHEAMHIVDWTGAMGEYMHAQGDKSRDWHAAFNKDSHVADKYAQNNHVENFAQYAGLILYDRVTNKALQKDYPTQYNSIVWQIRAQGQSADNSDMMFALSNSGRKCTRRWPLSPAVNPANGQVVGKKRNEVVDAATQALLDIEPTTVSNCTFGVGL